MKRFKNILVVYSRNAFNVSTLRRAGYLAAQNRARLTFLEVIEDDPDEMTALFPSLPRVRRMEMAVKESADRLRLFANSVVHPDVEYVIRVARGRPFVEIIKAVLRDRHDLVLITADGRAGFRERVFGGTSMHLMRKCPCPVWVIKPGRERFSRLMAAVDVMRDDPEADALNAKILRLATSLAAAENAHLDVLSVWSFGGREAETSRSELPPGRYEMMRSAAGDKVIERLKELLAGSVIDETQVTLHAIEGDPRDVIPERAYNLDTDLLVMGTVSRTGIPGLFIGNTAEEVLPQVACSVLSVKPEGFVSPVEATLTPVAPADPVSKAG